MKNVEAVLPTAAGISIFDLCVTLLKTGRSVQIHEIGQTADWLMS
jgi:hypothetical protein